MTAIDRISDEGVDKNTMPWAMEMTSEEVRVASNNAINVNYDITPIETLERQLWNIELSLPASRSPDVQTIFKVVEQITWSVSLHEIYWFLENTRDNSSQSRSDLQRCWMLLQKIAAIQTTDSLDWKSIFQRLNVEIKKEAA